MPRSARDVVLARAAHLDPKDRETLDAAAPIGTNVEARLLERVVPGSSPRPLVSCGLVAGGPTPRFRHEAGRPPWRLKDTGTGPGGTNIEGLHEHEKGKLRGTVISAVRAATEKSKKLGQG